MNPLSFLQYLPENQRENFISSLSQNNNGNNFRLKDSLSKAGSFAMDNISGIGQSAQGLVELSSNLFSNSGIETDEYGNRMTTDIYGRPVYSYQNYQNSIDMLKDKSESEVGNSVMSGAGSGLKTGASIGSMIAPGIGTAIGAVGGLIGGGIAGLIGGKKRKREALDEISNRENKLKESTMSFNQSNTDYFRSSMADSISSYLMSKRGRRLA